MGELSLFLEKLLDTTAWQLPWVPCVFVWYGKIYGIVVPIKSFLYKEWLDIWNTFLLPTGQDVDNQWEQEKWERTSRRGQQKHKLVKRGNISLPQKKKKISISTVSASDSMEVWNKAQHKYSSHWRKTGWQSSRDVKNWPNIYHKGCSTGFREGDW